MFLSRPQNPPLSYFGPIGSSSVGESYGEAKVEKRMGKKRPKNKKKSKKKKGERDISVKMVHDPRPSFIGANGEEKEKKEEKEEKEERRVVRRRRDEEEQSDLQNEEEIRQEVNTLLRGFFVNTEEERFLSDVNMFLKTVCGNVGVPLTEGWAGGISGGLEGLVALALEQMRIRGVFALFGRRDFHDEGERASFPKKPRLQMPEPISSPIGRAYRETRQKRIGLLFDGNTYATQWESGDAPEDMLFQFITNVSNSSDVFIRADGRTDDKEIPWIVEAAGYIQASKETAFAMSDDGGGGAASSSSSSAVADDDEETDNVHLAHVNFVFKNPKGYIQDLSNWTPTNQTKAYQILSAIALHALWSLMKLQPNNEVKGQWRNLVEQFYNISLQSDRERNDPGKYRGDFRSLRDLAYRKLIDYARTALVSGLASIPVIPSELRPRKKPRPLGDSQLPETIQELKKQLKETNAQLAEALRDSSVGSAELADARRRADELRQQLSESRPTDEVNKQLAELEARITELTDNLEDRDAVVSRLEATKKSMKEQLEEAQTEKEAMEGELTRLNQRLTETETQKNEALAAQTREQQAGEALQRQLREAQKNLETEQRERVRTNQTLTQAQEELTAARRQLRTLQQQGGTTTVLQQEIEDLEKQVRALTNTLAIQDRREAAARATIDEINEQIVRERAKLAEIRSDLGDLESKERDLANREAAVQQQLKDLETNAQQNLKIEGLTQRVDTMETLTWLTEQVTKAAEQGNPALANAFLNLLREEFTKVAQDIIATGTFSRGSPNIRNRKIPEMLSFLLSKTTQLEDTIKELSKPAEGDTTVDARAFGVLQQSVEGLTKEIAELGSKLDTQIAAYDEAMKAYNASKREYDELKLAVEEEKEERDRSLAGKEGEWQRKWDEAASNLEEAKAELEAAKLQLAARNETYASKEELEAAEQRLKGVTDDYATKTELGGYQQKPNGDDEFVLNSQLENKVQQYLNAGGYLTNQAFQDNPGLQTALVNRVVQELREGDVKPTVVPGIIDDDTLKRAVDAYLKDNLPSAPGVVEEVVRKLVDRILAEKKEEIAQLSQEAASSSSSGDTPPQGVATFGKPEDIQAQQEDQDYRAQQKELAEARAKLAMATRTLEVANQKLAEQAKEAKDDEAKIAQLSRAADQMEKQAANLDVRKKDLELRETMLQMQRERQLTTRLRGGAGGSLATTGGRRGGGGGGGGPPGGPPGGWGSGDPQYDAEMQRRLNEARVRSAEIDLQRKMVDLEAARRRAEDVGASSSSASSSSRSSAPLDPSERAFRKREQELKLRKLEADLQAKMLALSTKRAEAEFEKNKMVDDPDPQKEATEREKRQVDLAKAKAQLEETMAKLANEKRKADREERRDSAIEDVLNYEQIKRQLELQKLRAQANKLSSETDPETLAQLRKHEQDKRNYETSKWIADFRKFSSETDSTVLRQLRQYEKEKRDAERRRLNSETSRPNLRAIRKHEQEKREYESEDWDNRLSKAQEDLAKAKQDLARARARDATGYDLRKLKLEVDKAQAQVIKQMADNQQTISMAPLEREKRRLENQLAELKVKKQQLDLDNDEAERALRARKIDLEEKKITAATDKFEEEKELQDKKYDLEQLKVNAARDKARMDRDMQREKFDYERDKYRDEKDYTTRKRQLELEKMEEQNKRQRLDYEIASRRYKKEQVLPQRDIRMVRDMLMSKDGADVAQVRAMLSFIGIKDLKEDRVLFEHFISAPFVAAIQHALNSVQKGRKITFVGILQRDRLVQPFAMVTADAYRFNMVNNSGSASVLSVQQAARKLGVSISKFKSLTGGARASRGSFQRGLLRDLIN